MTMLSPGATYHAELREQLDGIGRALSVQRALTWLARGLAVGSMLDLLIVLWAWARDGVGALALPGLVGLPFGVGLLLAVASVAARHEPRLLARRVDRAAGLQERSVTALELGRRGDDHALAIAQMRDAVEHLRRLDLLETFPIQVPKPELMTTLVVAVLALLVGIAPNPWLLKQRASNPAATVAREQAQRVERLADSLRPEESQEIEQLRELVRKGARTIEARSSEPESALNALEDLEDQIRQMGAGDDQLAAALAAVASALASDENTQPLASAIETGDLREISRATKALAQRTEEMDGQTRSQVAKVLRDASNRASRASPNVAGELADAAAAMAASAGADGDASGADGERQAGGRSSSASSQSGRSAQEALNALSSSAASAAERQRAQSQLEGSRNALERALGRTQSRAGGTSASTTRSSNSRSQNRGDDDSSGGSGLGQSGDPSGMGDQGSGGSQGGQGASGEDGQGGGFSTGGTPMNRTGSPTGMDAVTRPEQVPLNGDFAPDYSNDNPYLNEAGEGSARASDQPVNPSFSRKATQGNDSSNIPLGLRDLVKDYFSSLDQK